MNLNNQTLGIAAMIGAPFLGLDFLIHGSNGGGDQYQHTSLSGLFSLIYITSWMLSMIGLTRLQLFGQMWLGRFLPILQLVFLAFANIWNIYEMVQPAANTTLYYVLDAFWPLSNLLMLATGIEIFLSRRLDGWKRYVPLLVGLWLPLSIITGMLVGQNAISLGFSGIYSAISWTLLGYILLREQEPRKQLVPVQATLRAFRQ